MTLKVRDPQTKVKHLLLGKYLAAWGGIIYAGLSGRQRAKGANATPPVARFIYVDCFAGQGRYAAEGQDHVLGQPSDKPIYGSPVVGVQALDDLARTAKNDGLVELHCISILIEENPTNFRTLLESLELAGFSDRVVKTRDFRSLKPGQIAVVQANWLDLIDQLLDYSSQNYAWAFYLLDPYGPLGIPLRAVSRVINRMHHDVMINFAYSDLHKKTGQVAGDRAAESERQKNVDYWSAAFGDESWIKIAQKAYTDWELEQAWRDALGEYSGSDLLGPTRTEVIEQELVNHYHVRLETSTPNAHAQLTIKRIPLHFPNQQRRLYYLFLTTHDPTGALTMNKLLYDAELKEQELRFLFQQAKRNKPPVNQPFLFPPTPQTPVISGPPRPDIDSIAGEVAKAFSGRSAELREVYQRFANTNYFDSEIDRAVRALVKKKTASFTGSLNNSTRITFD